MVVMGDGQGCATRKPMRRAKRKRDMSALSLSRAQLELAIGIAGSARDLAGVLGVDPSTITNWRYARVPWRHRVHVAAIASRWPAFVQRESHKVRMAAAIIGGKLHLANALGVHASAITRWVGCGVTPVCPRRRAKLDAIIAQGLAQMGVAPLPAGCASVAQVVDVMERAA